MRDYIVSRRTYLLVDLTLLLLALLSIGLARVNLGGWNPPVALSLAAVKAVLIGLFFMELKFSSPLPRLVSVAAILWLAILLVGTMDDVVTRAWLPVPGK